MTWPKVHYREIVMNKDQVKGRMEDIKKAI
jgi:hypothetical protein